MELIQMSQELVADEPAMMSDTTVVDGPARSETTIVDSSLSVLE